MKLLYEITVIDIPHDQWHQVYSWPIRLALVIIALIVASKRRWRRLKQTVCATRDAIRIVATSSRIIATYTYNDLAYKMGRAIVGNRLENPYST